MDQFASTLAVLAFMALIYGLILGRGRRTGKARWKDFVGRLGVPESWTADVILALLALALLIDAAGGHPSSAVGGCLGLIAALTIHAAPTRAVLNMIGLGAGMVAAWQFVSGDSTAPTLDTAPLRLVLMTLVLACFVLGMGLGLLVLHRSPRIFAFGYGRGLAFFGLIDAVVFFASPGGVDTFDLPAMNFFTYLAVACVGAVIIGLIIGPFTLWVLAMALTMFEVALPGSSTDPGYLVAGVVVFLIARAVTGRRLGSRLAL